MDPIVLRAMQKWPDVPRVYGWLRLDRRGQWLIKSAASTGRSGGFERIGNAAMVEFIGRNYAADEHGRWFFQNGPQRVFLWLDYAPWVCRLNGAGDTLVLHTGGAFGEVSSLHLDEAGSMLVAGARGVALLDDRDLAQVVQMLEQENRVSEEALLRPGARRKLSWLGQPVKFSGIVSSRVPKRFAFDPRPMPRSGEPEC